MQNSFRRHQVADGCKAVMAEGCAVLMLEAMAVPVLLVEPGFVIGYVNRAAAESMGRPTAELIGQRCFSCWAQRHEPCSRCAAATAFESGRSSRMRQVTPDGRVWMMEASPIVGDDGRVLQVVETAWEITESEVRVAEMDHRRREIEALLDNLPDLAWLKGPDGRYLLANQTFADEFGLDKDEIRGKTDQNIWPAAMAEHLRRQDLEVLTSGRVVSSETSLTDSGGVSGWVEILVSPVFGDAGEVIGIAAVARDITARKHAEEERKRLRAEIQQAQKMEAIGTLAGGVAHDFNNLLMAIQGMVSYLLYDLDVSHPHYKGLMQIEKQVKNGAKLTGQLLGYARKGRFAIKPLDLNRLVRETAETFGRARREISIHTDLSPDLVAVEADQGQLEQVLLNLYINAWQAMPGGGDLTISTANVSHEDIRSAAYRPKPGQYVRLAVADSGEGMDEKTRRRIFEPFFTTKEMGRGTGLGLATVYGIIKGHHGYIEVDSIKGEGTTFRIYLPASKRKARRRENVRQPKVVGKGTILVVDDEEMVLEVSCALFEKLGFNVLRAESGRKAVEVFKAHADAIDLVILDMIMPQMSGGEVFDTLKDLKSDVKVLLSSGYALDGQAEEILARGCQGFIQKPFDIHEVARRINELLE